jgi:hypothetical protein
LYNSGRYDTISINNVTTAFLYGILNELISVNSTLGSKPGAFFAFIIEPFLPTYLDNSHGGAYPHMASSNPVFPMDIEFNWASSSDDEIFINQIQLASSNLLQLAIHQGQNIEGSKQILYPNYGLPNTCLSEMYGNNVARLLRIRKAWDPEDVIYLTGGFKF